MRGGNEHARTHTPGSESLGGASRGELAGGNLGRRDDSLGSGDGLHDCVGFWFFFVSLREERGIACVRGSGRPVVQGAEMNDHNDLTTWLVRVAADPEAGQGQPGLRRD